jgi:hypothetical protein
MPKSRGRKPRRTPRARAVSGDPRRRQDTGQSFPWPVKHAAVALSEAINGDLSDPLTLTAIPALFLNMIVAAYIDILPAERCVDDCLVLAHAYAQMGMPAQVRAVQITVTDIATGASDVHGTLQPRWEDGLLHGHTAVWLPDPLHLVDPTVEQYEEIAAYREGPVIAGTTTAPSEREAVGESTKLGVARGYLRLTYALGTRAVSAALLDHPSVWQGGGGGGHFLRGVNIAAEVVSMIALSRPPDETGDIPYKRLAAMIDAIRIMDEVRPESGFLYFQARDYPSAPLRLDQIPLPQVFP